MAASFVLVLDTAPPASPTMVINGGADITGDPVVLVALSTASDDVREMKVWGDVDPTADGLFQPTEDTSAWTLWAPSVAIRLSSGTGRKYLYARLKDDVCNETPAFTDWINFDSASPVVSISNPPDHTRLSVQPGPCGTSVFSWVCNQPFDAYQIRVVPAVSSPVDTGVALGSAAGSVAVANSGVAFPARTPIVTSIKGLDLQTASPGDGTKIVKIYVHASGAWSS